MYSRQVVWFTVHRIALLRACLVNSCPGYQSLRWDIESLILSPGLCVLIREQLKKTHRLGFEEGYAGKALRTARRLFSENVYFAEVVVDRVKIHFDVLPNQGEFPSPDSYVPEKFTISQMRVD